MESLDLKPLQLSTKVINKVINICEKVAARFLRSFVGLYSDISRITGNPNLPQNSNNHLGESLSCRSLEGRISCAG